MESVYVMIIEVAYDKPITDEVKGWHMVDKVFESIEDCQKYIDEEFDENNGFVEKSEGHYVYQFILDRELVSYHETSKEILANSGDKMTIMVDKTEFIRKGGFKGL